MPVVPAPSSTRLYRIHQGMLRRCRNQREPSYRHYGARGICVCPEWRAFSAFSQWALANGYQDGLTLDRIDVNGNYEPSNCRWADAFTQANNRRDTVMVTAFGETKTIGQWVRDPRSVVSFAELSGRIRRGWDAEQAITDRLELEQ